MTSEYVTNLFINLFMILIMIQITYFWHVKYGVLGVINPLIIGIGQVITIVINVLLFSVTLSPGNQLINFSSISIILGIYYGGYLVGLGLYMLTLIIASFYTASFEWIHFFSG